MNFNVGSGVQEYNINGKCKVYFNPSDPEFSEKVFNALDVLMDLSEKYGNQIQTETDNRKIFSIARELDGKLRETINGLFGEDVCTAVFGTMHLTASADGLPVWVNFMLALIDIINDAYSEAEKALNPKLQKLVTKYKRK